MYKAHNLNTIAILDIMIAITYLTYLHVQVFTPSVFPIGLFWLPHFGLSYKYHQ